ncbi:type 2 lanthipeptide synthetase LanM [Actinomyces procaprae]|uniref:type 2 lanthipeptide synthetase LanM n=1 Tax=Actinomyces procaprae TaxID=2560010 RepID=UPI0010A26CF9|nr:type 2 lanthipeptide synthetase LanM [Actinomyces procaprae]
MTTLDATDLFPELDSIRLSDYLERMSEVSLPPSNPGDDIGPLTLPASQERTPFQHLYEAVEAATYHPGKERTHRGDLLATARSTRRRIVVDSLDSILTRPLVSLLRKERDQGALRADTPHDRYREFTRRLASRPSLIRSRFPVAWTMLMTTMRNTEAFLTELVRRLELDWDEITSELGIPPTDTVTSLQTGGDCHHHGRRVTTVTTSSGVRFVYKPRSMDGEWAYEQIVSRLAPIIGHYRSAHVIRKEGYGYAEFVEATDDVSLVDAAGQTGGLSALFYVLGCNDLHAENVLLTADGPVPIDMETMLHPYVPNQDGGSATAHHEANRLLAQSVFGTGVLPMVVSRPEDPDSYYDVGLLGPQEQVNGGAFRHHAITNPFTDEMSVILTKEGTEPEPERHRGTDLDEVRACSDAFASAFSRTYRALMGSRETLLNVVADCCSGLRLRYIHNPTQFYAQILSTLTSPLAAGSAGLARMLALRVGLTGTSHTRLIAEEVSSLLDQDIPYFTTDTSRPHVLDAAGARALLPLDRAPIDTALERIRALDETDLARQLRLIRSAFCGIVPDESIAPTARPALAPRPASWAPSEDRMTLTDLAANLGGQIVARMLTDTDSRHPMTWIGPLASVETTRPWPPGVLGYDLYTGRLGTALALARAGRALSDTALTRAASQIFDTTIDVVGDDPEAASPVRGTYAGAAGVAWALWAAGQVLERPDWCRSSGDLLRHLWRSTRPTDPADELDTISGVIASWRVSQMLGVTEPIVGHDLDKALATITDGSWKDTEVAHHSGFAHGTAGVLYTVAQHPQAQRYIPTLLDHLATFWDEDSRNWFTASDRSHVNHGWCHGRAGVLLGLAAARLTQGLTDVHRSELTGLTADIANDGAAYNLTYCHGSLGDYDAARWLIDHGACTDTSVLTRMEEVITPQAIARKSRDPHSRYSLSDGLMIGIAGSLLHLAERIDPTITVSPTTLEVHS